MIGLRWRKEKAPGVTEMRCFLGWVVLSETSPGIEAESSACKRQDGVIKMQGKRGQYICTERPKAHDFAGFCHRWVLAHHLCSRGAWYKRSFNHITHPGGSLLSCPSQLIHDCLYLYIWLGGLLCLHIPTCRTHINS